MALVEGATTARETKAGGATHGGWCDARRAQQGDTRRLSDSCGAPATRSRARRQRQTMPPPPRVLEQFYKTKTVEQIEQSDGHKRSGFARVQLDGGSRWTQQWVVLDVGGDCAVVCLARAAGPIKPAEVLSSSHYSAEPLDTEEAQGPSDFCFQLTDFGSSPPRHHLFSVDSAEDRDGWLDAFDDHGVGDGNTGTGFSVTDMTGEYLPPRRLRSPFLFVCVCFFRASNAWAC